MITHCRDAPDGPDSATGETKCIRRMCAISSWLPRRYNIGAMKLEIEINVADGATDKVELQEYLRKEAILALFADRKITAGKAAHELGMERLAFMELLKTRGIPYVIYTAEDWEADARAVGEFERRRKIG